MCKETTSVFVKIPADLSHTGKSRFDNKKIDRCIASLVRALQSGGIDMRASCCGHGTSDGEIILQDGRKLIIMRVDDKRS